MVLNAEKHRGLITSGVARDQTRERVRRYRERRKASGNALSNADVTPSETETETKTEERETPRAAAPIHDRSHRKHAICGRVCLHAEQFGEFVRRRNTDNADQEIRAWAARIIDDWTTGANAHVEPGDQFDFWRARYEDQWPSPQGTRKSKRPAWLNR